MTFSVVVLWIMTRYGLLSVYGLCTDDDRTSTIEDTYHQMVG